MHIEIYAEDGGWDDTAAEEQGNIPDGSEH